MKKIIFILILLSNFVFASDYTSFCNCAIPKKSLSGTLMSATGVNFLSRKIAENKIASEIKKETNSKFKVKLKTEPFVNIAHGNFSSFSAYCKNYISDRIYLSDVLVESVCPYNKIYFENNEAKFSTDTPFRFTCKVTQDNMNKMAANMHSNVLIRKNDLYFKHNIAGVKISYGAKPKVANNKIYIKDIPLINLDFKDSKQRVLVENVFVKDSIIYIEGYVIVLKG